MPEPRAPAAASVTLRQLPFAGKLALRGGPDVRERAGRVLGFPLPTEPLRATAGEAADALRLGPDEWLLLVPAAMVDEAAEALAAELAGLHHALVGVSHGLLGLAVEGEAARDVLAAGCPIDLHPRAFPEGAATRTLLGKAEIILHRPAAATAVGGGFRLHVARSFAIYTWRYLEAAAREFVA